MVPWDGLIASKLKTYAGSDITLYTLYIPSLLQRGSVRETTFNLLSGQGGVVYLPVNYFIWK